MQTKYKQLPVPSAIQERWRNLSFLEALCLGPIDPGFEFITYLLKDAGAIEGHYNDCNVAGAYASIYSVEGATLFYRASQDRFWEFHGPEIERTARRAIRKLPLPLRSAVPSKHPKSLGWTFAVWAPPGEDRWIDLTGLDEECWNSVQFKDCHILYADAPDWIAEWVAEQFERPGREQSIEQILRSVPLTRALAKDLMSKYNWTKAVEAARRRGYPLKEHAT